MRPVSPMHIPDGYLSPSTCAVLYGAALPFWYGAFARVKWLLNTRLVPLLAVASAFCFRHHDVQYSASRRDDRTRGGSRSGHDRAGPVGVDARAVHRADDSGGFFRRRRDHNTRRELLQHGGRGLAGGFSGLPFDRRQSGAHVIPSNHCRCSRRLRGDQCFGVSYCVRIGNSAAFFQRRRWSAAIRSLSVAHRNSSDDDRTPLLRRHCRVGCVGRSGCIPAALESFTAGKFCVPRGSDDHSDNQKIVMPVESWSAWRLAGPLWIRLALLMLLTPLGILAAGTAWGEWSASEFSNHEMRQKIAAASGNVAPPAGEPRGLQRLSSLWTAPFPQYAPSFIRRPAFGYVMSAMFGSGLILAIFLLMGWLLVRPNNAAARGSP